MRIQFLQDKRRRYTPWLKTLLQSKMSTVERIKCLLYSIAGSYKQTKKECLKW